MKTLERRGSENENAANEVQGLRQALDKSYTELREQARTEWERKHAGHDPSDACVRVRIGRNRQTALTH
jgi:hypothetical protein